MLFFPNKKINWKKVAVASLIVFVIETVVHQIEALIMIKYYIMPEYFGVWSKLMMPKAGPPPPEFFILSALFSLAAGFALACVYECIKDSLPKKFWIRVLAFTKLMVVLMLVFAYLPMFLMVNIPTALVLSWMISGALVIFLGSVIYVKILK